MKIQMGTYIIRVYKWDEEIPSGLAGVVEEIREGKVQTFNFRTAEELVEIITGKNNGNPKRQGAQERG